MEQIEATLACGISSVIVDFRDLGCCREAVRAVRAGGATAVLATPRIHKPGESDVFTLLAGCEPDGVLVRNLAGLHSSAAPACQSWPTSRSMRPTTSASSG